MDNAHFVDFDTYCKTCSYDKRDGAEEPCNECLRTPARKNSRKPVKWKEKVTK